MTTIPRTEINTGYQARLDKAETMIVDLSSYRDGFHNLIRLSIVLGLVMIAGAAVVLYYVSYVLPQDSYYALSGTANGTEIKRPMIGLTSPNVNRDALLLWAGAAATEVMTFGFNDIDERMTRAQRLFTPEGWTSFSTALAKTTLIKGMLENQQLLTAIPASTPLIIMEGVYGGKYSWVVEMPIIVTLRAGDKKQTGGQRVRMIITKMPTSTNPMGIGINTWYSY